MHQSPQVFNGAAIIRKALPEKQTILIPIPTQRGIPTPRDKEIAGLQWFNRYQKRSLVL
jgi:hypothetical protein